MRDWHCQWVAGTSAMDLFSGDLYNNGLYFSDVLCLQSQVHDQLSHNCWRWNCLFESYPRSMSLEHFSSKTTSRTRWLSLGSDVILTQRSLWRSEGVVGREGGGGVVGQSHSNSEEEQTATDGTTDKNGSEPTLNYLMWIAGFVSGFLFDFFLIFQLFLLYQLTLIFICTILYHY